MGDWRVLFWPRYRFRLFHRRPAHREIEGGRGGDRGARRRKEEAAPAPNRDGRAIWIAKKENLDQGSGSTVLGGAGTADQGLNRHRQFFLSIDRTRRGALGGNGFSGKASRATKIRHPDMPDRTHGHFIGRGGGGDARNAGPEPSRALRSPPQPRGKKEADFAGSGFSFRGTGGLHGGKALEEKGLVVKTLSFVYYYEEMTTGRAIRQRGDRTRLCLSRFWRSPEVPSVSQAFQHHGAILRPQGAALSRGHRL